MITNDLFSVLSKIKMDATKPDDCWEWTGWKDRGGYGYYTYWNCGRKYNKAAYRITYEHWRGPITHELDHLCKNKMCVNPRHLEDVPHAVNMRRHFNYLDKGLCKRGHELSVVGVRPGTNGYLLCRECGREYMRRRRKGAR